MKIRLAQAEDLRAVKELTRRAYEHYIPVIGDVPMPMNEDYAPRIADGQVWLIEDGEPAGLIVLEQRDDALLIFSVAIAPERQRAGLGQRLLSFAEDVAREHGLGRISLFTNAKMQRNIRIYGRSGYRETRRRAHPTRADTIIVDMEKKLTGENRRSA